MVWYAICLLFFSLLSGRCSSSIQAGTVHVYMDPDPFATTDNVIANFIPTFERFLGSEIQNFLPNRNLTFELHLYDGTVSLDELISSKRIDFYYGRPSTVACLQATYFANPILTARKPKPGGGAIDGYGGAIVVSASNPNINSVQQLKGAVIGVQVQNGWATNILLQGILARSDIYIFRDAKQVCVRAFRDTHGLCGRSSEPLMKVALISHRWCPAT